MPASMTAFATRETQTEAGTLSWEIRSVNHRYLEVVPRLPDALRALEPDVRERVGSVLRRGRVECVLRFTAADTDAGIELNEDLVQALVDACGTIDDYLPNPARLYAYDLLRWPGVAITPEPDREALREPALDLLDATLDELAAARQQEGARLRGFLLDRCAQIEEIIEQEREHAVVINERLRTLLLDRLAELKVDYDPGRFEQELVIQLQRADVSEELDRLESHVTAVRDVLDADEANGRRLDFLMQELNREANTLGSKSSDAERSHASVDLKVAIEQMREQIQNIE